MDSHALSLGVCAKTWERDSHGLFDYESEHIIQDSIEIPMSGVLCRLENGLNFAPSGSTLNGSPILSIESFDGQFRLKSLGEDAAIWMVVREAGENMKCMPLHSGDNLKLGRVVYHVKEIHELVEESMEVGYETASSDEGDMHQDQTSADEEVVCRICYEQELNKENPLLSPCRCDGTVKYLHLNCLKLWIKSKVTTRQTQTSISYQWKTIECEICKFELPLTLKTKTAQVDLFEHDRPKAPYLVLETFQTERSSAKFMHVISMANGRESVKLGRGHESDVRINDISVSRTHAMLRMENGHFLVEDNSSKFGTLIRAENGLTLKAGASATIQVGRSLLRLQVQPSALRDCVCIPQGH